MSASRWRIHSARRLIGGAGAAALAIGALGCAGTTTTPPDPHAPASIAIRPPSPAVVLGDSLQLYATVYAADSTLADDQRVTWSVVPISMTVSAGGVISVACPYAPGTVTATSVADTAVKDSANVVVVSMLQEAISIDSISETGTNQPANLDSVTDSITVGGLANPPAVPCHAITEVDLVIHRAAGDTVVARVPVDTTATKPFPVDVVFHSDAKVNGLRVFPNGPYALHLNALISGGQPTQQSSTINFTIRNP